MVASTQENANLPWNKSSKLLRILAQTLSKKSVQHFMVEDLASCAENCQMHGLCQETRQAQLLEHSETLFTYETEEGVKHSFIAKLTEAIEAGWIRIHRSAQRET